MRQDKAADPSEIASANRLTERGGVALVCYHLARLGHEYAVTEPACPFGDVWAQIKGGKIGIEVKTTRRGTAWHVKRSQVSQVDIYCFVRLDMGHCWVLTMEETKAIISSSRDIYEGIALIKDSDLPSTSFKGWSKVSDTADPRPFVTASWNVDPTKRANRVVRYKLKDGTLRVKEYPPYVAM